ncbi:hypothetical protein XU18_2159 [Perkinsela sp. CCAP 1560/4]|nr:hypothetical protein XU18_2159 [Perkinsela sp. CCAP 1560/4]|eukprot:KNH07114.1 hypothetical protein XU18_2159 [Perkinsela sp. CCAP 1560/4]
MAVSPTCYSGRASVCHKAQFCSGYLAQKECRQSLGACLRKAPEKGEICPEVLCKAQARLAKSTSKNHAEYPYYIRKNETVFQHGQCSGAAISKSCHLLQNDAFSAMIAGNPRASGTMMKAATSDKAHSGQEIHSAALPPYFGKPKCTLLRGEGFKISRDIAKLGPPSRETDTLRCARSATSSKSPGSFTQRGLRCVCNE